MLDGNNETSYIGISVGFVVGLSTIYGLEAIIGHLEAIDLKEEPSASNPLHSMVKTFPRHSHDSADNSNHGNYELRVP